MRLKIYTDGACSGNQLAENYGGWGAILEYGQHSKELYGGEENTTNNRMEMLALVKGLEALTKSKQKIDVFSDSSYLIECFRQKWYEKWIQNGWLTSKKTPVENKDLWLRLLDLTKNHDISYYRVKGHVNLNHPNTNKEKHYEQFIKWNGANFSFEDFQYITEKNNRADALANMGIDALKNIQD